MKDIPQGWHVSWMGADDGTHLCQIKRHDDDLNYISGLSFVSRKGFTLEQAYDAAIDTITEEYKNPQYNGG